MVNKPLLDKLNAIPRFTSELGTWSEVSPDILASVLKIDGFPEHGIYLLKVVTWQIEISIESMGIEFSEAFVAYARQAYEIARTHRDE